MNRPTIVAMLLAALAAPAFPQADGDAAAELARAHRESIRIKEELRKENAKRMEELTKQIAELDKDLAGFEAGREAAGDLKGTLFAKYAAQRDRLKAAILANPDDVGGAVVSGAALNLLVAALETQVAHHRMAKPNPPNDPDPDRQNYRQLAQLQLVISPEEAKMLVVHKNIPGEKMSQNIGSENPLAFSRFPALLRREPFIELVRELESAGAAAVAELKEGKMVGEESSRELFRTMNNLILEYRAFTRNLAKSKDMDDMGAVLRAGAFMRSLKSTTRMLTEASTVANVQVPPFPGGGIEGLIAYMNANNLRFSAARDQTEREYYMRVFQAMRLYYYDLALLDRLRTARKDELAELARQRNDIATSLIDGKAEERLADALKADAAGKMWAAMMQGLRVVERALPPGQP